MREFKSPQIIGIHETVPKGFYDWVRVLHRCDTTDISKQVNYLLENNYLYSAIEEFEKHTSYNTSKVWH